MIVCKNQCNMRFFTTTTWANEQRQAGAPSITYNEVAVTYNQAARNYNGQITPVWTNELIS